MISRRGFLGAVTALVAMSRDLWRSSGKSAADVSPRVVEGRIITGGHIHAWPQPTLYRDCSFRECEFRPVPGMECSILFEDCTIVNRPQYMWAKGMEM